MTTDNPNYQGVNMRTCSHMLERTIDHRATKPVDVWMPPFTEDMHRVDYEYQAGDIMVLVCPRGCPDIEITIGLEDEGRAKQEGILCR